MEVKCCKLYNQLVWSWNFLDFYSIYLFFLILKLWMLCPELLKKFWTSHTFRVRWNNIPQITFGIYGPCWFHRASAYKCWGREVKFTPDRHTPCKTQLHVYLSHPPQFWWVRPYFIHPRNHPWFLTAAPCWSILSGRPLTYNISFKLVKPSANALYYRVKTSKGKQKCRNSCHLFLWGMFLYCLTAPFSQRNYIKNTFK